MAKAKKATDHLAVAALLVRYNCPIPYHAGHARFMGSLASPAVNISPLETLKHLWYHS